MRKRRSRGAWFPVVGTVGADVGDLNYRKSSLEFQLNTTAGTLAPIVQIYPLTFDRAVQPDEQGGTYDLQAMLGNTYFLKRIVGKFHCCIFNDGTVFTPHQVQVTAGFFVARADEDPTTGVTSGDVPIGFVSGSADQYNYDPANANNATAPWIWRRSWILQNNSKVADDDWGVFPSTTAGYGSVADGPHIDAKTKRVVPVDHRLWFAVSATSWPWYNRTEVYTLSASIKGDLDVRVFASPFRARNKGQF